jgi:hypothetical protein
MHRQVRRLIHKHRTKIEKVAHALISQGALSGSEIDQLIGT